MLDKKKVGAGVASRRKAAGLSQQELAFRLAVSPQAVSKWENGRSLPDTAILPALSQTLGCTVGALLLCGEEKAPPPEREEDAALLRLLEKTYPNLGGGRVEREPLRETERYASRRLTVRAPQRTINLIEKRYARDDRELLGYRLFSPRASALPIAYLLDSEARLLVTEDLHDRFFCCDCFDEPDEPGETVRRSLPFLVRAAAAFHCLCWEDADALAAVGRDFRHRSEACLRTHLDALERELLSYRADEEAGRVPRVWGPFENKLPSGAFELFGEALRLLRLEAPPLLSERLGKRKNVTVLHGDLHPGNAFVSKSGDGRVKFIDLEAVRSGFCAEDLAMLLALHAAPSKEEAAPLLGQYYDCLGEKTPDYSRGDFLADYRLSVAEALFFPLRLFRDGIYDFSMRDRALRAFEDFGFGA